MLKMLAKSLGEISEHVRSMRFEGRSLRSHGMRNPHDAYSAGYNRACDDISEVLDNTVIDAICQVELMPNGEPKV